MRPRNLTQDQCDRLRRLTELHGTRVAADLVGCRVETVRAIRARGWLAATTRRALRPRPSDFAIQAHHMKKAELCRHYRAGDEAVRRWSREVGRERAKSSRVYTALPLPDGSVEARRAYGETGTRESFVTMLKVSGVNATAAHYGIAIGTLRRWRQALGLPFSWSRQPGARRGRRPAPPSQIGWADRYHQENQNVGR